MSRTEKARLELCVILPSAANECDRCLARLQDLLGDRPEIALTHVKPSADGHAPELCLHYDPEAVTLPQLERWVKAAGSEVEARYGLAMGGAGTPVALETADVALVADDLGKLPFAVGLSRQARGVIRQNLYVSLGVVVILIAGTTTGLLCIGPAVSVHEGSTLVVIANALRLLAYGGQD